MWQPHWDSKDPSKIPYDGTAGLKRGWVMSKHFGGGDEACLLAGIVGHNLCIDRFGGPHSYEKQQGKLLKTVKEWKPLHGEAGVLPWTLEDAGGDYARVGVTLPEANLKVARTFTMDGGSVSMATEVTPLDGQERNIEWCEHVTIGDPFLDGATVETEVDGAWLMPGQHSPDDASRFPGAMPLDAVPVDQALAMPLSTDPPCGDVIATRVSGDGSFKVSNLGRTLGYSWDTKVFPWLCLWTENKGRQDLPWEGVERTRGFEFSSKPFPEGPPPPERATEFQGKPTTCVVPGSGLETSVKITWE